MEGDSWADFGSATTNSQVDDDDDDDWADFGGFESATPTSNGSSQTGSLITWAAVGVPPPASPSQTSFNQSTAHVTSSPNPVSAFTPQFSLSSNTTTGSSKTSNSPKPKPDDHADSINSFLSSNEDFSSPLTSASPLTTAAEEDKSNEQTEYDSFHADFASFLSEAINEPSQPLSSLSERVDDIAKGSSSVDRTSKVPELSVSQGENGQPNVKQSKVANGDSAGPNIKAVQQQLQENASSGFESLDNEVSSAQDILSVIMAQQQPTNVLFDKPMDNSHGELSQQLRDATEAKEKLEETVNGLEGKLSIAEQEKRQLQKEHDVLLEKNKTLEDQSKNLKETLAKQKEKYEQLQEQHQDQIKEIRKAGHDALAVIVEEYKELSRKAVLEQQEENKIQMENVLEEQQKKFQDFLQDQQESFERMLQGERRNSEQRVTDLVEEQKQCHKAEIESCLEEERFKSKEALDKVVEDARLQGLEAVEMARKEERQKYEAFITERKEAIKTLTDQEAKRLQTLLEEAIKEEKDRNQVALENALTEERKRGREFAQEIKEETKNEMVEYSRVKQEADKAARQKHLHGLDLFLESARTQLKALMEDQPEKDPDEPNGL